MAFVEYKIAFIRLTVIIFYDKQRPTDPARVCKYLELSIAYVSNQGNFVGDVVRSSEIAHGLNQMGWISMYTNPDTVDKNLGSVWRAHRLIFFKDFHAPLNH